jgi:hypothetical protein
VTNILSLYSGYKQLVQHYVGVDAASSPQARSFACPADTFYLDVFSGSNWPPLYVPKPLHEQPCMDFSSYGFNGGDNLTRTAGTNVYTRLGLGGTALSSVKHPARTRLVVENSAPAPWSWHEPSQRRMFNDAKNAVSFADGHVRLHQNLLGAGRVVCGVLQSSARLRLSVDSELIGVVKDGCSFSLLW